MRIAKEPLSFLFLKRNQARFASEHYLVYEAFASELQLQCSTILAHHVERTNPIFSERIQCPQVLKHY